MVLPIEFFGEERLKLALEVSQTGTFFWDTKENILHWDDNLYRLFDRVPSQPVRSVDDFMAQVHPDDRNEVTKQIEGLIANPARQTHVFRIITKEGSIRWIYDRMQAFESGGRLFLIGACTDVTSFKLIEQDLQEAKAAAEAANEAKSRFLANISHEIRTPLAAIVSSASVLVMDDDAGDQEARERTLDIIVRNSNHLQDIVNDILDVSKIEAGMINLVLAPADIGSICQDVFDIFHMAAKNKGIGLSFALEVDAPLNGVTDIRKVKQILLNLVGNAIKFTATGSVSLRVESVPPQPGVAVRQLAFVVSDTGIGLAAEDREKIFSPFVQADNSVTRQYPGTGLGLVISRRLARALGGDVVLSESRLGQGSSFVAVIDFPNVEVALAAAAG